MRTMARMNPIDGKSRFLIAISMILLGVPACSEPVTEDAQQPADTQEVLFSIETRAMAPPEDGLPASEKIVELPGGERAVLRWVQMVPPSDPSSAAAMPEDAITVRFAAGLDLGERGVKIYDSTEQRRRDFSFSLADPGVIRGLREAIPGMGVGEVRRLRIPWELGYGEHGRGEIPPKTDLVFAVELVSID